MTPPALDAAMVQAKLHAMRDRLDDLDAAQPTDVPTLTGDRMLRHGVERILTQLVELAGSINGHLAVSALGRAPESYRDSFELVVRAGMLSPELAERLKPSVGQGNVLVHEYAAVDLARVDYRAYVRDVAGSLPA